MVKFNNPKFYHSTMDKNADIAPEKLRKLGELQDQGIDTYPYSFLHTHHAKDILEKYKDLEPEHGSDDRVSVAGRIMLLRSMGKLSFLQLYDETGKIQLYCEDATMENYKLLKKLDLGDIVGVEGTIYRTKLGEISVKVHSLHILCKSLRQMPEKYHGLQDVELRYRQRYLDLIINPEVKQVFQKRTAIISAIREFMNNHGFMEVETPILQTIYGGAEARPFITHINEWDMKMYLSISPELYLKRLLVGGYEKVYTICKNFRNEGADKTHNPEFTMMEFYQAYVDYNEMMRLTEELYEFVAKKVLGRTTINYEGKEIELKAPWKRMTVNQCLKKFADIDVEILSDEELEHMLSVYSVHLEDTFSRGVAIAKLFEELCESKLIQPTFVIDYPKEITPLCKQKRGNDSLIEKTEPYINGWEIGNGYSELNDPLLQKKLLEEQAQKLRGGAELASPMDEDFVKAIEYGMPPAGGMGVGIDRMVILLTEQPSLRDVILFPTMKPEKSVEEQEKKVKKELKKSLKRPE